jgi:hypothetical protein
MGYRYCPCVAWKLYSDIHLRAAKHQQPRTSLGQRLRMIDAASHECLGMSAERVRHGKLRRARCEDRRGGRPCGIRSIVNQGRPMVSSWLRRNQYEDGWHVIGVTPNTRAPPII